MHLIFILFTSGVNLRVSLLQGPETEERWCILVSSSLPPSRWNFNFAGALAKYKKEGKG